MSHIIVEVLDVRVVAAPVGPVEVSAVVKPGKLSIGRCAIPILKRPSTGIAEVQTDDGSIDMVDGEFVVSAYCLQRNVNNGPGSTS